MSSRVSELQQEIWAAIGEILHDRSHGEPLVDTSFWSDRDRRAYETALQNVRLMIEKKAGGNPEISEGQVVGNR